MESGFDPLSRSSRSEGDEDTEATKPNVPENAGK